MTITLSVSEWGNDWQPNDGADDSFGLSDRRALRQIEHPDPTDLQDVIYWCQPQYGRGYHRLIEMPGISIRIFNELLYETLLIQPEESGIGETSDDLEFGFNLSGSASWRDAPMNFVDGICGGFGEDSEPEAYLISGQNHLLKVDVHVKPAYFLQRFLESGSNAAFEPISQFFADRHEPYFTQYGPITPLMKLVLEQLIHCPFQGFTKRIYLESKCLELIALKLAQMASPEQSPSSSCLKPEDIERIYYAQAVLQQNYTDPPSLLDLARQVRLNDRKLKQGFREVFGTTVFGYLHDYRMKQAQQLLATKRMNINEIGRAVGYASRSAFYTAFKKKFGINPSNYLS
ncbi:MAG: AraC family transcriptional regulator [Aphanocapsa sp. GSE-SYN-MK-11-07L]|jgi:AraC-like DNA-binding protein|nr:AraC family transcriptional regulator [Aphanocapsa sp. GSE-SYN-MK-11-07L]